MIESGIQPYRMRIAGYVPLSEHGFAIPAYQRFDARGNAWYHAMPEVDGDHRAAIAFFDSFEGREPTLLETDLSVTQGDPWLDVFLWRDRRVAGTPQRIFADLCHWHDELAVEAPLTFLDLSLAAGASNTAEIACVAREFLRRRLGSEAGERGFCEGVLRSGVALEIRRCLHRRTGPLPFGAGVGFDAIPVKDDFFRIALDGETLRRVTLSGTFEDIRVAIARFGEAIDVSIEVLEPLVQGQIDGNEEPAPPEHDLGVPAVRPARQLRSRLLGIAQELAIDLGTNNIRVYARGRGLVLSEPSLIAVRTIAGVRRVLAVGAEAKLIVDRAPENVEVLQPLRDGVIVDLDVAVAMLSEFMRQVRAPGWFRRPLDLIICLPAASTSVERRALKQAANKAGASKVWLVEAPIAAALGADLPVDKPLGSMIVQIGGGTTEIAVIALRGIALCRSIRVGGDRMDEAIVNHVRRYHNLLIGLRTAELLKEQSGQALEPQQGWGPDSIIRGRDLVNGLPKQIKVTEAEICSAIAEPVAAIIEGIHITLENIAPELAGDIVEGGIVLAGGSALLSGLEEAIRLQTGLPVWTADDPANCVTRGLARMLEDADWRERLLRS